MKGAVALFLAAIVLGGCGSASSGTRTASSERSVTAAGVPTTVQTTTRAPSTPRTAPTRSTSCPRTSTVLVGVYHPDRLQVINSCRHITGTVISTSSEQDGDLHFDVRLDPQYKGMLMPNNYSEQHGALVVELMPRDHGHLPMPSVGDRVSLTGAYVDDTEHDWSEVHPVWGLSINGGRTYRSGPKYGGSVAGARSANAVATCRTSGGAHCNPYDEGSHSTPTGGGGSSPSSSSGSSSGSSSSSSSSGQVVHPGAFCAPEGAHGVTSRGTSMTCKTSATDSRARWRHSG